MATYTENYSLNKPDDTDYYDVQTFNDNMDVIDNALALTEAGMNNVSEKADTIIQKTDTVISLLQQGSSAKVYRPTDTVRTHVAGVSIAGSNQYASLTSFTAVYNGSICLKLNYTHKNGTPAIRFYDAFSRYFIDGSGGSAAGLSSSAVFRKVELDSTKTTAVLVFPVIQGQSYYFDITCNSGEFIISSGSICYDIVSADSLA